VHPTVLESRPSDEVKPEAIMDEAEGLKFRMVAGFLNRRRWESSTLSRWGSYRSLLRKYSRFFTGTMPQRKRLQRTDESTFFLDEQGGGKQGGERNGFRI